MSPDVGADPLEQQDEWDWPYILYVGRVWLKYSDEQTWNLTPKQFKAQLDIHAATQKKTNGSSPDKSGFIDQLSGW